MADKKVIEGTNITASQMKEICCMIASGLIDRGFVQAIIEHRDPWWKPVLHVENNILLDPVIFNGLSILQIDEDALSIDEIDFKGVTFENVLNTDKIICGDEKLTRHIEAWHVLGGAVIGQVLYLEKDQKTLEYLYKERGITWFELLGTIFVNSDGDRTVMYLTRVRGRWTYGFADMNATRVSGTPSLVIARRCQFMNS